MDQDNNQGQGRGWHGDPEGHAKAGRKGGKARARNNKTNKGNQGRGQNER